MIADMHTHSENSHDSNCKIEDMCLAQIKKGTEIFAVTDHCDTFLYNDFDIYTPIKRSCETVQELNKKYKDKCLVLAGVEIGEGFWYPEVYKKVISMLDYDVVIGSVHSLNFRDTEKITAKVDFSSFSQASAECYIDTYFDEILKMLDTVDCDILAHLSYPLRYVVGIYGFDIDISKFYQKIDGILKIVIQKGIALEVNTSSYELLNDFMPGVGIIKRYYDLGGRMITLGSDAHVAQNASIHFDDALKALKEIGFDSIYYFKKRKPFKICISV